MQTNAENVIESIRRLPLPEQEKVRHWMEEQHRPGPSNGDRNGGAEKFRSAMRWIEEHRDEYLGQWVCLDGDKLVAHGSDANTVYSTARSKGIDIPFIEQIRVDETAPAWGGWD